MKILRFNEKLNYSNFEQNDKIVKGSVIMEECGYVEFEIKKSDLMKEEEEYGHIDLTDRIIQYITTSMEAGTVNWDLVDYNGEIIEDEKLFDKSIKYNI